MSEVLKSWLQLLRPHQWLKNLMLLFPPFLGGTLLYIDSFRSLLLPILSFSMASSSVYIVNDIMDIKQDIHHPVKKNRPLPSGKISTSNAISAAILMALVSGITATFISNRFLIILGAYLVISNSYSLILKSIPLVEIFCVVSGFLLRLEAGGTAFSIHISEWLFLSVFLLALFLVSGKRLSELMHSGGQQPGLIRPVLKKYPDLFFQTAMSISGSAVLVTYTMYAIDHHSNILIIPLCCFGLLRYSLRVLAGRGGDPTRALLKDPQLLAVGLAWALLVTFDIYT